MVKPAIVSERRRTSLSLLTSFRVEAKLKIQLCMSFILIYYFSYQRFFFKVKRKKSIRDERE